MSRFIAALAALSVAAAVQPLVDLGYTKYQGTDNGNGVTQWLGMRYASPPVGQLRFSRAQDPACNDTVQPADKHGPICLGTGDSPSNTTLGKESEDCLFLHVYAPTNATAESKLPVYFFIQGGGFVSNSNSNYNGTGLIQAGDSDLLVVTFNYRVGSWGFLTDGDQLDANNGLWDQVKALEWVQQHIQQFGGDPQHVVLGGDSAGAGSIAYHLTREGGKDYGLFVGAAAESVSVSTVLTIPESQYLFDGYAIRADCAVNDPVACLRAQSVEVLQNANVNVQPFPGATTPNLFAWNPVIDGTFIQRVTYEAFQRGETVKVPIIMGDDENGGTTFTPPSTSTIPEMNTFLRDQFPYMNLTNLQQIDELFPNPNATCPNAGCRWRQVSNAYQSQRYMCPGLYINELYTGCGVPSYAYLWNVEDQDQVKAGLGVPHTVEVHAVFGPNFTHGAPGSYYPGNENYHAVEVTQAYWTSFIRTLDPNTHRLAGSAEWGVYSGSEKQRMEFGTGGTTAMKRISEGLDKACQFLNGIAVGIHQ